MFFFFPEISPGPLFSKQNAGRSSRPNTHTHPNSPITHTPTHRTVAWETASFWGTVVRPLSCLPALEAAAPPWRPRSCRRCYILWEWPSPMRTDVVESSSVDQRPLTWLDLTRFGFVWKASSKWKASWILKESFLKQVGCGDASLMCPCFFCWNTWCGLVDENTFVLRQFFWCSGMYSCNDWSTLTWSFGSSCI